MEFVKLIPINRICPCCGNGNYMRIISGKNVGELNVKCINCNSYYNYDELLKRDNSKPLNGADGRTIADLISRAAAIDAFDDERVDRNYGDVSPESVIKVIESIPAVDAALVVHGRWIDEHGDPVMLLCSECGYEVYRYNNTPYCPYCGAKMDGERRDSDG